ncbi:Digalactosyldiacylglycerol synthase 1, chloroplastic [Dichanthelium oligosanthes]|uniref:Digalactosyldiacylglycerol synthase 1, chloroplastic n=1 Tax=Dichanthelium oligosanthes TaxID=888268 RepID=A0A1E5WED6_9POAL|nr:Digalactosyldiacylglycerol synthase 1, chloroplastic [Dichanthelium oligosanthes]
MASFGVDTRPAAAASGGGGGAGTGEGALSFLSRGLREDLRLIRARAGELETFLNAPVPEPELFARLRRAYSSSASSARTRLDLSAIGKAFEAESWRGARGGLPPRWGRWEEEAEEWEPVRMVKARLRELERRTQQGQSPSDMLHKVKLSLKSMSFAPEESEDVPPLDLGELFAYFLKQSVPLFDQLGIKRDVCNKLVESLCSKRKDHHSYNFLSASEPSSLRNDNVGDELDLRIASVLQSTGHHYEGGFWSDGQKSDISDKRHVAIVTTASLPWMTGTAVNPLFRAAYLAKSSKQNVTLVVPWLCKSDQELVYPNSMTFNSPEEQENYMRNWLEERVGFKTDFKISFYPGKFQKERRSIIPAGDTSQFIPSKEADIAILEEPEHLNWYHHGKRWTDKFNHVVGVVHTNYLEYIKREKNGAIQAFFVKHINNLVARAYCHKILRLSGATQDLPKSMICNVHGVNPKFLEVGERIAAERESGQQSFSKGAYFLGKMVWAKGYRELIDLFTKQKSDLEGFKLDIYGNGEDSHEVQSAARKLNLNLNFHKGRDHADDSLHGYKVFINPSISDVLCTATAEALAMGKFVICADHPSNDFFRSFPNCLTYKTSEDFVARVKEAMTRDPQPLTAEQRYNLSWEAATQRFMEHSELKKVLSSSNSDCSSSSSATEREGSAGRMIRKSASVPNMSEVVDGGLAFAHYCFTGNELLRLSTGAVPGTRDYSKQHSLDLHILPPQVNNPIYGW